jgi:hypothetical protein
MKLNRHFKRYTIDGIDLQCKMLSDTEVYVLKMSRSAAFIMLDERLNIGSDYTLNINHGDRTISVKGTVVSEQLAGSEENRSVETGPAYIIGVKFNPSSVKGNSDFTALIEEFTGPMAPKGLARHVHLKIASGLAGTDIDQPFLVREISFGGMQIISHRPLAPDVQLHLEMNMPDGAGTIRFIGRVASCADLSTSSLREFQVGIEYIDMRARDLQRLKDLIYQIDHLTD